MFPLLEMSVNPVLRLLQLRAAAAATAPMPQTRLDGGAGAAVPVPRIVTETSLPKGILSGESSYSYSQSHGLPSPFIRREYGGGPYVIIGHGFEELVPFDERPIVPPGITLVTNILAGVTSTMPQTCGMMNMLSREENRDMVMNPVESRFAMKRMLLEDDVEHLHVYTEGQKMPKLFVKLLGDFSYSIKKEVDGKPKQIGYQKIFRSGVYEFPIKPYGGTDDIHISERLTNITANNVRSKNTGFRLGHERKCLQFLKRFPDSPLTTDDIREIYKDSLHPTPDYLASIVDQIHSKDISTRGLGYLLGDIPLTDIFAHIGPGVYYFIICRADKTEMETVKLQNVLHELNQILHPDWLVTINNDGEEKYVDPIAFYKEFRISPYDVDFVRESIEFINSMGMSPIDMETKKLVIRQRLDELPESVQRALQSHIYFPEQFVAAFKAFVEKTAATKQLIRRASIKQQVRNGRRSYRRRRSMRRR